MSTAQIRAVAAELPMVGLEDALAILLALLDREPQSYHDPCISCATHFLDLTVNRR